jgi:hypothetical protein
MLNLLCTLLGIERPGRINPYDQLEIRFHKEANRFGEHGTLVASHIRQGIDTKPVRFVFVGMATPPKLTLELHTYIWEQAKAQGYLPHDLQTYGKENEVVNTSKPIISAHVGQALPSL